MQYRKFGPCGYETSLLGFGCMRLPTLSDAPKDSDVGNINEQEAIHLIRTAIDKGVNYVDTAYPYHGGKSEVLVGKALQDGYREKVKLATKLPIWAIEKYEDFDRVLNEQLAKLQTDHVDVYLVHALNKSHWQKARDLNVFKFLDEAIKDGRVKHAGFSFHDQLDLFKEIVDAYDWSICQIQLNYMDENYQAGVEGLRYAANKGLAVVIMEPLRGGKLVHNLPDSASEVFQKAEPTFSAVEWALRWVANFPEVSVILSGMGKMSEVEENIRVLSDAKANSLTPAQLETIAEVKNIYNSRLKVNCTECRYCVPCPNDVAIPDVFAQYNNASVYDAYDEAKHHYANMKERGHDASSCIECGICESKCPQNLEIIQLLKDAHAALA